MLELKCAVEKMKGFRKFTITAQARSNWAVQVDIFGEAMEGERERERERERDYTYKL